MKNKYLIYILSLSMIFLAACAGEEIDKAKDTNAGGNISKENVIEDENTDDKKNDDLINANEEKLSLSVTPKNTGVKFDIDLDTYKSILPLTEDWEFYHDAEKAIKKELLTIDGEIFDDSVLFFECSDQYITIVSDKNDFSSTFIGIIEKNNEIFEVKFVERFRYSFNSAKEEVLQNGEEIILMTQFPFSAYSLFGKFIHKDNCITYDSLVDYDSSVAYYTEFMELLNEGAMDQAMQLEDYSSYPFSYESLYFKSGNLAIKKSLEFAKFAVKKDDDERARILLEWGLALYLEKHYNYTLDIEDINFESVYVKKENDFGYEYVLSDDFMIDYLNYYLAIYRIDESEEQVDKLRENIDLLKVKLSNEDL